MGRARGRAFSSERNFAINLGLRSNPGWYEAAPLALRRAPEVLYAVLYTILQNHSARRYEVLRDRSLKLHPLAGARVGETKLPGVQHLAREMFAPAIQRISQQRMAEVFQMDANLVRPARVPTCIPPGLP